MTVLNNYLIIIKEMRKQRETRDAQVILTTKHHIPRQPQHKNAQEVSKGTQ